MKTPRIGVVGSINTDLVTFVARMPEGGETVEAPRFAILPGGKGANQAVAAAKLGAQVMFVGAVGDDIFGENALRDLASHRINTSHLKRVAGVASGVATILVEESGENRILIVKGANGCVTPEDVERAAPALAKCDLILCQFEIPLETIYAVIRLAPGRVVLNPAPAQAGLDLARIRDVAFLIPNESELALMGGEAALLAQGVPALIVTLGARGARLVTARGATEIAPVPVTPVDTTGAGDAFAAAFARYFAGGLGLEAALGRAGAYAALSVTRAGAQPSYLSEAEFEAARLAS